MEGKSEEEPKGSVQNINPFDSPPTQKEESKHQSVDVFSPFDNHFDNSSSDGGDNEEPTRVSGNDKTLLKTLTHGNIKEEIMEEVRRGLV